MNACKTFRRGPVACPIRRGLYPLWWLSGKESACDAGDMSSIPGLGRSPGEGNDNPLQYPYLDNPMDRETWRAAAHGVTYSQTQLE